MSGMYDVWRSVGGWYAMRWYGAEKEYAGPFDSMAEALAWARR